MIKENPSSPFSSPVSQITLVFISQMEKLRLGEARFFYEHSRSFLELRTECRSLPQSCSVNTVHSLSVPIIVCASVSLFSDSSSYSDSFLSNLRTVHLAIPLLQNRLLQYYTPNCLCVRPYSFVQVAISRLGHFNPCCL